MQDASTEQQKESKVLYRTVDIQIDGVFVFVGETSQNVNILWK